MVGAVPRGKIKSLIKMRLPELRLDGAVDLLIFLSCELFLQRLATEARLKAIEDKSPVITSAHIRAVAKTVLKQSRG
ncbi:centromere protein W [Anomaloglossus baeobatrachus]|uniref:centromere protein W n=1 Tax=Anomaloglossus baeobatrachus TaxID=238106 RepID=UPI003F508413